MSRASDSDEAHADALGAARSKFDARALLGGLIAVTLGILAIMEGRRYPSGSLLRMGPGYFPMLLGSLLVGLGGLLCVSSFLSRTSPRLETILWRPVVMIPASILCFALLVTPFGLIPAVFALVFVSLLSERTFNLRAALFMAVGMTAFVWLVFTVVLAMPYPLLSW